jgi:hypothetical protein
VIEGEEMCGACSRGEMRNAYNFLVEKSVGKRPLRKHRHIWEDDIEINHKGWIQQVQDRVLGLVNMVTNI